MKLAVQLLGIVLTLPAMVYATADIVPVPTIDMQAMKVQMAPTPGSGVFSLQRLFPSVPAGDLTTLTAFIRNYNRKLSPPQAAMMAEAILGISQNMGVDYRLVTGVVAVESSFRSDAVSSSGAIGLGQLKPTTATWLGVSNPFDPLENLAGTTKYIRFLIDRYNGNLDSAIAAYFQGQGFIDRNGITEICKTYLTKVNTVISKM